MSTKINENESSELIKVTIPGGDNMCGYNNCNVEVLISKEELIEILEEKGEDFEDFDGELWVGTPGGIMEIIETYSSQECVFVTRYGGMIDLNKKLRYEKVELETINTTKKHEELNTEYYKKGIGNPIDWSEMKEGEMKEEYEESVDYGENKYHGFDIYTIENFDLELELKSGY